MKLNPDFLTYNSSDESYVVPVSGVSFSGMIKGNKTMGAIIELLKEETILNGLGDCFYYAKMKKVKI